MKGPFKPNADGLVLARQLRQLRENTGLTQEQVGEQLGEQLGGSASKVHRIEQGQLPWPDELGTMLDLYKVSDSKQAVLRDTWDRAWQPRPTRAKQEGTGW
ncbi:helix-turn-helix domain-containing protein [Kibdelosporangium phytohabitans]|uniref:HTH cro/C1-type domain-containing protein n=1 Tax=Kibdelosporangium phytohabitans TaxID=860235 RepID=A0A0N9HYX2_9PSEU|nr:helix-turn-helix transcriptional regulator [Kibdelosporangium phytohabitans]ALG07449.1 hypothetical protein AOZ06_11435 [Kibdelosporangium phytohabitans]MBE1471650.1 transcriptional regulator with XRE-family HTH domain [Kibdelosporangium phytohabitans]